MWLGKAKGLSRVWLASHQAPCGSAIGDGHTNRAEHLAGEDRHAGCRVDHELHLDGLDSQSCVPKRGTASICGRNRPHNKLTIQAARSALD